MGWIHGIPGVKLGGGVLTFLFTYTPISIFWNISPCVGELVWEIQKEMKSAGYFISLTDELRKNKNKTKQKKTF